MPENASRWFDPDWYLQQYPDIAQAGLEPLQHYLNHGVKEGRLPCRLASLEWDQALWQQEQAEADCVQALTRLAASENPLEASYAAFALGRWHGWQDNWQEAARVLVARSQQPPRLPAHHGPDLLAVEALTRSGQLAGAWRRLLPLQQAEPEHADVCLAVANLLGAQVQQFEAAPAPVKQAWQNQRLGWINRVWRQAGLEPAQQAGSDQPLTIDNLAAPQPVPALTVEPDDRPLVSVIIPAYNAESGLRTALNSLVGQTLARAFPGAVEVVVVNDASTDNTAAIADAFAWQNPDVRVIHQTENSGAYAARNRGLAEARGQCITVHDADDWSHPRKLEAQWQALQEHPQWMACNSHWVRCTPDLQFSRWRMEEGWVYRNTSSLMFRRQVFETLGYWDEVRVEADTEYYYRIRAAFGAQATGEVLPGVPLAFGRVVPTALTVLPKTHLITQFKGVRADYRKAAFAWHEQAAGAEQLYMHRNTKNRPFEAPVGILR
ncbi:glycosyltransferase family 2 protein [Marinobacter vinifirmus]|uniref:Glycosyltransferase family 2 protein n=1 Tax=Marinobacter vinifirmus TaxID=355591 RepID=A0A558B375_9GAMM|nr:glycosyltransferase family 2 protein [Marinobacter vinifirmus]TVT30965.1 MAG: glycosyltransferase family 2 protein [Marinobacter vinifirmus]